MHCDISGTFDIIASKFLLKHQKPEEHDYDISTKALYNQDYLWKVAGLSYTPKIHSVLVHALEQMRKSKGIGDMLEDDV